MFKELHPNIKVRIYTSFLSRVIGSMIFPFMAIYFTNELNATIAGILIMAQTITQFVASLYGGYLADTLGRKKVMVAGESMKLIAFSGMLMANSPIWISPWFTFAMLLIISISSGITGPAADAMLVDVSTKDTRAFMYSINYWASNLSLMLGLIVGGWFFQDHFFTLLGALFAMSMLTLWMTITLIQETYHINQSVVSNTYGIKNIFKTYQSVLKDSRFLLFTLGGIAILSIEFQRNNYISIRLARDFKTKLLHFPGFGDFTLDGVRLLSWLTVENTILIVLFTTAIAKWIRYKNEKPFMYTGFLLFGVGYGLMAISNNPFILMAAVLVLSLGELLYVPTRQSLLVDLIDETKRGSYMAFNGLVFQMGKIIGAVGIIMGHSIGGSGMAIFYLILVILGVVFSQKGTQKKVLKTMEMSVDQKS